MKGRRHQWINSKVYSIWLLRRFWGQNWAPPSLTVVLIACPPHYPILFLRIASKINQLQASSTNSGSTFWGTPWLRLTWRLIPPGLSLSDAHLLTSLSVHSRCLWPGALPLHCQYCHCATQQRWPNHHPSVTYCFDLLFLNGNQSWIFIRRTDAEAEAPMLWPPGAGKDSKAGREGDDRGWNGWMVPLIQWTWIWVSGDSEGQGNLVYCGPWGRRVRHNWATELQLILHTHWKLTYSSMVPFPIFMHTHSPLCPVSSFYAPFSNLETSWSFWFTNHFFIFFELHSFSLQSRLYASLLQLLPGGPLAFLLLYILLSGTYYDPNYPMIPLKIKQLNPAA